MLNEPQSPFVLALDAHTASLERVGGKGASLARLAAAGLPVPPGFHITTNAYRHFVAANDLAMPILAAVAQAHPEQPATLDAASQQIATLFARHAMPDAIAIAIRQAYAALGAGDLPVAVRSSATAEDLPDMSFAGQQDTYLNMRGEAMVLDAVKRCWASLWTARAIGYRARNGIAPADVSLAVVVQELVPADAAGIMFTANPLTGQRDQVLINAAWGLGEAIVGGEVTPDTLVIEKNSGQLLTQQINEKRVMTVRTANGTHEAPVPAAQQTAVVLAPAQAAELARLGEQIERLYGQPMDIEWTLADSRFAIVQARPITALPEPQVAPPTDWSIPNPQAMYFRASIVEMLPDPLTPLFATMSAPAVTEATKHIFTDVFKPGTTPPEWLRFTTINGYAYYEYEFTGRVFRQVMWPMLTHLPILFSNLGVKHWRDEFRPRYMRTVAAWEAQAPGELPATKLLSGVEELLSAGAEYYTSLQMLMPVAGSSETSFTSFYQQFVRRAGDPPAQTFLLGFDSTPLRAEKSLYDLAAWSRTQPGLADALLVLPAKELLDNIATHQPPAGVDAAVWNQWCTRFQAHLNQYGRMVYDLDFAKPVPIDDPSPLLETLKYYVRSSGQNPHQRQAEAVERREAATRQIEQRLDPLRRSLFERLLKWAQENAPPREDALADQGWAWPVLRRMLFEIGRRLVAHGALVAEGDVFWLEYKELQRATIALDSGQAAIASFDAAVRQRKAEWRARKLATPPPILPEGKKMWGMDMDRWMPVHMEEQTGNTIKGLGASAGTITAVARVLRGPEDFSQFQPGDVLIANITTPAWTPLFALASAVVTDVGGPLSHGSIVAREYGIPAVLGTGVATRRIHSGQTIRVNGDAGTVTLLDGVDAPETLPVAPEPTKPNRTKTLTRVALVVGAVVAVVIWLSRRNRSPSLGDTQRG